MDEMNLRNYAYLGDAVWELFIRKKTKNVLLWFDCSNISLTFALIVCVYDEMKY